MIEPSEILFVGQGATPLTWYRCALPAMNMGADWCGIQGTPPNTTFVTGIIRNDTRPPDFDDYKVVVIQQARGKDWLRFIKKLQKKGIVVLYEIDDYIHGVRHVKTHDWHRHPAFSKKGLEEYELCMRLCDGIIVSTPYLGELYRKMNPKVYVCPNGLDVARFNLTRPERSTVNIGWAGATGHAQALAEWMTEAVMPVMAEFENVCFVAIGDPSAAEAMQRVFGEERAIGTPFTMLECYPAAMTMIDIALAPMGTSPWHKAKSDLRWLETGALGIPLVAGENGVYAGIRQGFDGFRALDTSEAREIITELVDEPDLRWEVGEGAREHVYDFRTAAHAALGWLEVCRAAAGDYDSVALVQR